MATCGVPQQAIEQIKTVHACTEDARKKLCAAGPSPPLQMLDPSVPDRDRPVRPL